MAGSISATTAAVIGASIGAIGTGYSIYAGQQQNKNQKKSLQNQENAQQQAEQQALSTQRKSEIAQNAANMKTPDIASILSRAAQSGSTGLSSTMLTGPSGVDTSGLNLGKATLLGQ